MNTIRRILWQRLDADMTAALGVGWTKKKIILYGAGGLGLSFMQTFPQLSLAYAIDSDPKRRGERFHGLPVESPDVLKSEDPDRLVVFITSSWHEEIRRTLEALGLVHGRQIFYGGQQAHGRIFFHLRELADFGKAFAWLDERGVEHVVLRWFESLPEVRPIDIDLLVRTSHLDLLFENPFLSSAPGGIPIEVYWDRPLGHEDELLYYPSWLADEILSSRRRLPSGAWSPSDPAYLRSLAYHVVFHKGERAKLPIRRGEPPVARPNKYLEKLEELSRYLGIAFEPTLDGLWHFLERENWLPPIDLARRYASALASPWLTGKVGSLPGAAEDVLVFVFRDWLVRRPELQARVVSALEAQGLFRIQIVELSEDERMRARERIRGGNWVETAGSREGGGPAAFGIFFDSAPEPPEERDRLLRPFCRNRKLGFKSELKQEIGRACNGGRVVNFLHAADDE
ncbi:hypothetical protein K2X89_07490, partial [Myxococcota bacterium]|nr:hypothetical protein [Myxococcota bacterium]